jgi:hypothetical protein
MIDAFAGIGGGRCCVEGDTHGVPVKKIMGWVESHVKK